MMVLGLRFLVLAGAVAAYRLSALLNPVYRAMPQLLLEPVSFLVPPGIAGAIGQMAGAFFLLWMLESLFYRKALGLEWQEALSESLRSYQPLALLWCLVLLLFPGLPGMPLSGWWVLLDGSPWLLTMVLAGCFYRKGSFVLRHFPAAERRFLHVFQSRFTTALLAITLLALLFALTPKRLFTQPYDDRWGTGDEPRYVRIAASLLHDGDADIGNAAELVGRKAEPIRFVSNVLGWIPSSFSTAGRLVVELFGAEPEGEARPLGGQVIRGRDGGTYYVYLPGFPLLMVPAMALDSLLNPDRLSLMLFACLTLGAVLVIAMSRLVEPWLGSRFEATALCFGLGLTVPLFFHHFQVYPEVAAALCLTVMLRTLLGSRLERTSLAAFAVAAALLPWLHTKYYPIWGICLLALAWKAWRAEDKWKGLALGLAVPILSLALQCLYLFHITGSIMPDALWVLNRYSRGATIINRTTPSGLYHLFLGSWTRLLF